MPENKFSYCPAKKITHNLKGRKTIIPIKYPNSPLPSPPAPSPENNGPSLMTPIKSGNVNFVNLELTLDCLFSIIPGNYFPTSGDRFRVPCFLLQH